jgi:glutamate racemase
VSGATDQAPIGIFDSGLGGLTVAHEVMRQLPHESFVYFGDTARVPYGPKSPDTVRRYSREITQWLLEQGVKAVVVACNTATAHALPVLRDELPVPVLGVIEPGARAAVAATRSGHIGVIGTVGTIKSGAYERAIRELEPDVVITARPCPLFVPLVEEGYTDKVAAKLIARDYLQAMADANIDTLVLGCTHYPLLKPLLAEILGSDVRLIDSAEETAAEAGRVLADRSLASSPGRRAEYRFVASDDPRQFHELGQRFLGDAIEHVEIHTLG